MQTYNRYCKRLVVLSAAYDSLCEKRTLRNRPATTRQSHHHQLPSTSAARTNHQPSVDTLPRTAYLSSPDWEQTFSHITWHCTIVLQISNRERSDGTNIRHAKWRTAPGDEDRGMAGGLRRRGGGA